MYLPESEGKKTEREGKKRRLFLCNRRASQSKKGHWGGIHVKNGCNESFGEGRQIDEGHKKGGERIEGNEKRNGDSQERLFETAGTRRCNSGSRCQQESAVLAA